MFDKRGSGVDKVGCAVVGLWAVSVGLVLTFWGAVVTGVILGVRWLWLHT